MVWHTPHDNTHTHTHATPDTNTPDARHTERRPNYTHRFKALKSMVWPPDLNTKQTTQHPTQTLNTRHTRMDVRRHTTHDNTATHDDTTPDTKT